ncbi:MAG: hypothetical protein AAGH15_26385 [Myxococcota bacterium]
MRLVAAVSLLWVLATPARAEEPTTFGIRFEVARTEGAPVRDDGWLDAQVAEANRLFAPAGVAFTRAATEPLPDAHRVMTTRRDRHGLAPRVGPALVHVFVVESLANVDEPGFIQGVHWRSRSTGTYRHYVLLSRIAGPSVLGHELGHFFGNPHSDVPGNIMSYARGEGPPAFDRAQLRRIRRFRDRFVGSGELVPRR